MRKRIQAYADSESLDQPAHPRNILRESFDTTEYMNEKQLPGWDFPHSQEYGKGSPKKRFCKNIRNRSSDFCQEDF